MDLSINLREGQYCTVGCGAAADYCINTGGVGTVHCRVGCRSNGGFIECLDSNATIVVNGSTLNRSRLSDGDALQIGSLPVRVVVLRSDKPPKTFAIAFEDETKAGTEISPEPETRPSQGGAAGVDSVTEDESSEAVSPDLEQQSASLPIEQLPQKTASGVPVEIAASPLVDTIPTPSSPTAKANNSSALAGDSPVNEQPPEPNSDSPLSESDAISSLDSAAVSSDITKDLGNQPAERTNHEDQFRSSAADQSQALPKPVAPGRALFEFDSTDPSSSPLVEADLQKLAQLDSVDGLLGNHDLESMLDAPLINVTNDEENVESRDTSGDSVSAAEDSEPLLSSGIQTDKHWKWTGGSVLHLVDKLLSSREDIKIYVNDNQQMIQIEPQEMFERCERKKGTGIYLLSTLSLSELFIITRQKKWDGRLGHPQALSMFLTLSQKRISDEFFEPIDACLLLNEGEVELLAGDSIVFE